MPNGSFLKIGDHPVAESIRHLGISPRLFMSVYYPERAAILPSGTVLEEGVIPLDGHIGKIYNAPHRIESLTQKE